MIVAQVAAKTGISPCAIRYYTHIGLLTPAREFRNGYHRFMDTDVKRLSFIRKARALGFTLKEIRMVFETSMSGQTPCPLVREIVQRHVVETSKRLEEVVALLRKMKRALRRWKNLPDRAPRGDSVCYLIECHS